jgi:hypothetical protein
MVIYREKIENVVEEELIRNKMLIEKIFSQRDELNNIVYKVIDNDKILLREKMFNRRLLNFKYTTLMHATICANEGNELYISGRINVFPLVFVLIWYLMVIMFNFPKLNDDSKWIMLILFVVAPIIVFFPIYLIQKRKYRLIKRLIEEGNKK